MYTQITIIILILRMVFGFIGYDCGSSQLNVTTLSLREVGECEIPEPTINSTRKYLQLLQINEYSEVKVIQCKIEIHRIVYYCGMYSHVSIVLNGEADFIADISKSGCIDAHKTGILKVSENHVIHGLIINQTASHSIVLAGYVNGDGTCDGTGYSDPFGSWTNVVVQGTAKITLTEQIARGGLESNKIHLRSGTICSLSEGSCIDQEGGHTFWNPVPSDDCKFRHYSILYEGYANKIIDYDLNSQVVYSLSTQDITFALAAKGKESVCGHIIYRTEHPKLVIFETSKGESFASFKKISVSNLDIFAYVNSKFVYVEKHIRSQMKLLYRDVIIQKCNLERQTLKNSLSIATQAPDEFAFDLMKGPGYMAVVAGEVVHIVKCVPVEVKIQHGEACFAELQVTRNNQTLYMNPRTHILKSKGTQIQCNRLLPSHNYVTGLWYKILPLPTQAQAPTIIKPMTKSTWGNVNPEELATNGIYTEKEIEQLRERIMFPIERPALLNDVAREMRGQPLIDNDGSIFKLLNENAYEKFINNTWNKVWNRFVSFGTFSAGVIALMIIFQFIKALIDIILHGYALHSAYGWSIHLIGAIWSSITHLLLQLAKNKPNSPYVEGGTELLEVQSQKENQRKPADELLSREDQATTSSATLRLI